MFTNVPFAELEGANLVLERIYQGGDAKNVGDDPINKLVPGVGNQGGFRPRTAAEPKVVVLYTSGEEPEWPDALDLYSGMFTYFGDNRQPGRDLHEAHGNDILRRAFDDASRAETRHRVPLFLVFQKTGRRRDVMFRGIAVPGAAGVVTGDDLVAVWRARDGSRFQNYRATFTILNASVVTATWLQAVRGGDALSPECPPAFRAWLETGRYQPLISQRVGVRGKQEQMPSTAEGVKLLEHLHGRFKDNPYDFEACAVSLWRLLAPGTGDVSLTRPWRDGGRDAVGHYLFGSDGPTPCRIRARGQMLQPPKNFRGRSRYESSHSAHQTPPVWSLRNYFLLRRPGIQRSTR